MGVLAAPPPRGDKGPGQEDLSQSWSPESFREALQPSRSQTIISQTLHASAPVRLSTWLVPPLTATVYKHTSYVRRRLLTLTHMHR